MSAVRKLLECYLGLFREILSAWLYLRYTLWGYKLPPRPPNQVLNSWVARHGLFQGHNMAASFKAHTGSSVNMVGMPGTPLVVFVEDPADVEKLLTDMVTFPTRGPSGFDYWVPQGLLALETGPKWSLHRQLISRCLTTNFLKMYMGAISSKAGSLLEAWEVLADRGEPVDAQPMLARCTLDIIASVAFGIEFDALNTDETSRWTHAADTILDETALLTFLPPWFRFFGGRRQRFNTELAWVRGQLAAHDLATKGKIEAAGSSAATTAGKGEKGGGKVGADKGSVTTMIAMLRKVKDEEGLLSEEEIVQEVLTMGGAGHETTGNTLSWACYLLAKHPAVQARLAAELQAHVSGAVPTYDEATKALPFTLAVVYETLRLFPTVPLFPRMCCKPGGATVGGYYVPFGAMLLANTSAIHRDPRHFPDPQAFNPARFLGTGWPATSLPVGAPGGKAKFAFMPFGAGQRTCVGQRFAVLEAVVLLAAIVKRFELALPDRAPGAADPVREHLAITLRPLHLRLVLQKRAGSH